MPVEVRTVPLGYCSGYCEPIKLSGRLSRIAIRVDARLSWEMRQYVLIHEWAHAMDEAAHWTEFDGPKAIHGETWGVWYAKVYSYITDECWNEMYDLGLLCPTAMRDD